MGVFDMAKMASKAMQARKAMNKVQAAGQSGLVGLVINGLYSVVDIEINEDDLLNRIAGKSPEEAARETANSLKKDFKNAVEDAKKQLEKELSASTSLEDLKSMLQE